MQNQGGPKRERDSYGGKPSEAELYNENVLTFAASYGFEIDSQVVLETPTGVRSFQSKTLTVHSKVTALLHGLSDHPYITFNAELRHKEMNFSTSILAEIATRDWLNSTLSTINDSSSQYSVEYAPLNFDHSSQKDRGGDLLVVRADATGKLNPVLLFDITTDTKGKFKKQGTNTELEVPVAILPMGRIICFIQDVVRHPFKTYLQNYVVGSIARAQYNPFDGMSSYTMSKLGQVMRIKVRKGLFDCESFLNTLTTTSNGLGTYHEKIDMARDIFATATV